MSFSPDRGGHLISRPRPTALDVLGPTVELLTVDTDDASAPGLVRGSMPPGVVVPLHAHADPETFLVLAGRIEVLVVAGSKARWVEVGAGQVFHVPPHARHALRGLGTEPAVTLVVTTGAMVRFFERVGTPVGEVEPGRPPSTAAVERFRAAAAERGDWNGSLEDNAALGIELVAPADDPDAHPSGTTAPRRGR